MLFNTGRKYDFMPRLELENESYLEVVEECKLLGVMLQSNMKWYANTNFICQKGYAHLWMLRRLRSHGANVDACRNH
jgi:hypothetical protein